MFDHYSLNKCIAGKKTFDNLFYFFFANFCLDFCYFQNFFGSFPDINLRLSQQYRGVYFLFVKTCWGKNY